MVHNTIFSYNKGSTDGNGLVRQFINIISSYELIGIKIYGMVSDGCGGNTKTFKIIFDYKPLITKWISKNCLSTMNQINPSRIIYI